MTSDDFAVWEIATLGLEDFRGIELENEVGRGGEIGDGAQDDGVVCCRRRLNLA